MNLFIIDSLFAGYHFQALTIVDNFSRESLVIEIGRSLAGALENFMRQ